MARRQTEIPGTERDDVPPALLEAGEKWLDLRREKRRVGDKAKEAKYGVLALMGSHRVALFSLKDPETDEVMTLELDNEPKLRTKKTGDVDSEVGEGLPQHDGPMSGPDGVPQGLIAQAEKAQDDMNVVETADGDVGVPDKAAPKKKRGKGGGKKRR